MADTTEPPVKKKRGRKPKVKTEADKVPDEPKIPKKRGRKPKVKTDEDAPPKIPGKRGRKPKIKTDEGPKILKKRGRKPKDISVGNVDNNINEHDSDNIIIHLPISSKVIKNTMDDDLLTYNPVLDVPRPHETISTGKVDSYQFISQKNNPHDGTLVGEGHKPVTEYCQYPFDEKQQAIFDILDDFEDTPSVDSVDNINKLDDEYSISHTEGWFIKKTTQPESDVKDVCKIMKHIKRQRDIEKDAFTSKTSNSTVEKCNIQFDESNKTSCWPTSTSIYCWWCCHPFTGPPCSMPCEYKDDTFRVFGIFCSPECAAAHNFEDTSYGHDIWERYSLLNFLYRKIYSNKTIKIKLAPPKQILKVFGGHLSIKEFRINNANYNKTYKLVIPPLISIIPIQELTGIDNGYSSVNDKKYFVNIDKELINDDNSLRLKRTRPFNSDKNTLDKCMLGPNTVSSNTASYNIPSSNIASSNISYEQ